MKGKGPFLLEAHILTGKMDNEHSKDIAHHVLVMALEPVIPSSYSDIPPWYNPGPKCTCEEWRRTDESIQPPTSWHQGWMEWKVLQSLQQPTMSPSPITCKAEGGGGVIYIPACLAPCHFWSNKSTDAKLWNWIHSLPLGTAQHSWFAVLNRSMVLFFWVKSKFMVIHIDG